MAPRVPDDVVRERFEAGQSDLEIGHGYPGADQHYVFKRRMALRLLKKSGRKKGKRPQARHGSHTVMDKRPNDNAAYWEHRTIYPSTVVDPIGLKNLLVSGDNSKKIGSKITKGPRAGYPIYTLTLEERATCPTSCRHWTSCYGNNMHLAKRIEHGYALEFRLESELHILQCRHPDGFAVRLHVLGDFYSVEYVELWRRWLKRFPALFVFGFTARIDEGDPIAQALLKLVMGHWHRFAVRFSNAAVDECSTISLEHPVQKPRDAIICPAQLGKTESCGTCGLCWHSRRRIAFLQH